MKWGREREAEPRKCNETPGLHPKNGDGNLLKIFLGERPCFGNVSQYAMWDMDGDRTECTEQGDKGGGLAWLWLEAERGVHG